MAFIDYIEYDDASDELKAMYRKYGGKDKTPANVARISGPNPAAIEAHIGMYRAIMNDKSPITRRQQEMIAVVVSSINQCHY